MLHLWNYRASKRSASDASLDGAEFSLSRYEPMARLMSQDDLLFLRDQPGFRPEMAKKFERDRRRILRLYLEELAGDFHRLQRRAAEVVTSLPAEHASLVGVLLRTRFRFWYEMAAIEMRLSLGWAGLGSLDVSQLLNVLGTMQMELNRLAAPMAA